MKTIIISCDGTWQNSDGGTFEVPTNVTRLSRAIRSRTSDGRDQIVYYQSGVGSGYGVASRLIGGATGEGLSENVREAYGFLANNYHSGDKVVLIGFSRGAYTARSVCGLIIRLGILTKRGMDHFYSIFKDYMEGRLRIASHVESLKARDNGTWLHPNSNYVSAIGCFDTVGALGIPSLGVLEWRDFNKQFQFHDTDLAGATVGYAFHALALDENRGPFMPTLWELPAPPPPSEMTPNYKPTVLRQCWFPGVHTNIGGGYDDQEIADVTLAWMVQMLSEVAECVEFDDHYLAYIIKNDDNHRESTWAEGKIYDSATGIYKLVSGKYRTPGEYVMKNGGETYETIHASVRVRYELLSKKVPPQWDPKALKGWEYSRDEEFTNRVAYKWVKKDPKTGKIVKELKEEPLGNYEKRMAGKDIIVKYLGPDAWEGISDIDLEESAAQAGKESPLGTPPLGSGTSSGGGGGGGGDMLGKHTSRMMTQEIVEPQISAQSNGPNNTKTYKTHGPNHLPTITPPSEIQKYRNTGPNSLPSPVEKELRQHAKDAKSPVNGPNMQERYKNRGPNNLPGGPSVRGVPRGVSTYRVVGPNAIAVGA